MMAATEGERLAGALGDWAGSVGLAAAEARRLRAWSIRVAAEGRPALRPGAAVEAIRAWERRHGHELPADLRAWLAISDGLYGPAGPLVHPLNAIGPMIPFACTPGLIVQPESWFELGNPGHETVCIDLGYRWPGGDFPLFASGDDRDGRPPRLIAPSFRSWLLRLCREGGREYWRDRGFQAMGDPYLLPSIAAVVIGGTNILGGSGKFSGTVMGTILIVLLQSVLSVMQMPEAGRQIIYGVVIIAMLLAYGRGSRLRL